MHRTRSTSLRVTTAIALTVAAVAAEAHGSTRCEAVPTAEWRPQMALQDKLKAEGWRVRQVKTSNGCYEVYGTDAKGERTEAFFHPRTFERVDEEDPAAKK